MNTLMTPLRFLASKAILGFIRVYQRFVSPLFPPRCRFYPTCSQYALEAVQLHGPAKGSWLATKRICRCHPWGGSGVDFVPAPPYDRRRYYFMSPTAASSRLKRQIPYR